MFEPRMCPILVSGGRDCWRPPHPDAPYGLCKEHWDKIADHHPDHEPLVKRPLLRCMFCGYLSVRELEGEGLQFCTDPLCGRVNFGLSSAELQELMDKRQAASDRLARARFEVVYYLRWGDRIKIGTSRNLPGRMQQIWHDELLAVEPGSYDLERKRHGEFAEHRIPNYREWFRAAPNLMFFINNLRATHGEPFAAFDRWRTHSTPAEGSVA